MYTPLFKKTKKMLLLSFLFPLFSFRLQAAYKDSTSATEASSQNDDALQWMDEVVNNLSNHKLLKTNEEKNYVRFLIVEFSEAIKAIISQSVKQYLEKKTGSIYHWIKEEAYDVFIKEGGMEHLALKISQSIDKIKNTQKYQQEIQKSDTWKKIIAHYKEGDTSLNPSPKTSGTLSHSTKWESSLSVPKEQNNKLHDEGVKTQPNKKSASILPGNSFARPQMGLLSLAGPSLSTS